ncbi:MAG TPA: ferritin-like domain-containing protein [Planctomycetota bacterium]|nr:ferritin-like domain-containing protein [Planctomycetota bacterium]
MPRNTRTRKNKSSSSRRRGAKARKPRNRKTTSRKKVTVAQRARRAIQRLMGGPSLGELDRECLMDRLSEFLEHEKNGSKLYESGLEKALDEEQRERIQEFLEETRRDVSVLMEIIQTLGGDPEKLSPPAQLDRKKAEGLMATDTLEGEPGLVNFFENLVIAEAVDRENWKLLQQVRDNVNDEEIRRILDDHVDEIVKDEEEHFAWATEQAANLSMKTIFGGGMEKGEQGDVSEKEAA